MRLQRVCEALLHDPCDLLALLHGPHRIGCRLVMILLSQHGWSGAIVLATDGPVRALLVVAILARRAAAREPWPTVAPDGTRHLGAAAECLHGQVAVGCAAGFRAGAAAAVAASRPAPRGG
jgi:hypothetical protein